MAKFRTWIQVAFTALTNGYIWGFIEGKIYTGKTKMLCLPGLNCYSCPGALGSCPIGSLQAVLGSRDYKFSFYIFGFLMFVGALFGRFVCGFLCPFGLFQDILFKIPFVKKLKKLPFDKYLKYLKYVILILFVIILPLCAVDAFGEGIPWFCKYICPSGTLMAGIPLAVSNGIIRSALGVLFARKFVILAVLTVLSVFVYRPFCRYICPLGAIYGLFNPIAFYRFKVDDNLCIKCGKCQDACGLDIKVWEKPNSIECIRCGKCIDTCPVNAINNENFFKGKKQS